MHERTFTYDQLNRITSSQTAVTEAQATENPELAQPFATSYTYDADGNLKTLTRNSGLLTNENGEQYIAQIDNLSYDYQQGAGDKAVHHNRLQVVGDGGSATEGFTNGTSSYSYDAIGNLIEDKGEKIDNIDWTVYGKVERVQKEDGTVRYYYDAGGNRVRKFINKSNGTKKNTFYIKDASGNTIATYQNSKESEQQDFVPQPTSYYLFGSSRLGSYTQNAAEPDSYFARKLGTRSFELSNHLGNVLATVSDKKLADGEGFTTDVTTTSDWPASPVLPLRPDHERQKLAERKLSLRI